jgi:hypothetical protein
VPYYVLLPDGLRTRGSSPWGSPFTTDMMA